MTEHHPDGSAAEAVFRRALRDVLVLLAVLLVLGIVVGGLVAGLPGVWGALIGWGLAAAFSTTRFMNGGVRWVTATVAV